METYKLQRRKPIWKGFKVSYDRINRGDELIIADNRYEVLNPYLTHDRVGEYVRTHPEEELVVWHPKGAIYWILLRRIQ